MKFKAFFLLSGLVILLTTCRFDNAERWVEQSQPATPQSCVVGEKACGNTSLQQCQQTENGAAWTTLDDCLEQSLVCDPAQLKCVTCLPRQQGCEGTNVVQCSDDGAKTTVLFECNAENGSVCRGGTCVDLCQDARKSKSNVGCEYWAVDLDNARVDAARNAAAQQYAVVVSNPQTDVAAKVTVEQDDSLPGEMSAISLVGQVTVPPRGLRVIKLGPREVDGSAEGEFNTGTGTALTRHAYRITSDFPVVAVQFNPLENVNVFSNDASLLKPVEALEQNSSDLPSYVVVGWPQTIAVTDDPETNFNPSNPVDLRAFLTIVGTRPDTTVRVTSTTKVIPGGPVELTQPGGVIEHMLQPFDVLNLETSGFNADFTGSTIDANQPVVVFSGSEASDAPTFQSLSVRRCCADHLEEQLDPVRTAGRSFVAPHGPNRGVAVKQAGGDVEPISEPDYFRVVSVSSETITVKTSLPAPDDTFELKGIGSEKLLTAFTDFSLNASGPVHLGNISPSQEATGIVRGLPGGDPSLLIIPPTEQWRRDYVFLTPDKYIFDFVTVIVPSSAQATLDGQIVDSSWCEQSPADGMTEEQRGAPLPQFWVFRCQLGFPIIYPQRQPPNNVEPGEQRDGVHRVECPSPVGVVVTGFDSFVSYSYAAGTDLREIVIFLAGGQ